MNNNNADLPITALCIVTDRNKCPPNYTPIFKSFDANTETDLWKDSLFGKKINRFICYTKDYPLNDTYNVIEDIKLLNERENISGFIPVDKCFDNNEKSFQRKVLCIKVSHRFFTSVAVSDIILLVKSKRPPAGYSFIGEINNHTICIKFSSIPQFKHNSVPSSNSTSQLPNSNSFSSPQIPPRPASYSNDPSIAGIEQTYVHIRPSPLPPVNNRQSNGDESSNQPNDFYNTMSRSYQTQNSHTHYNPLQGVPFELNPIYDTRKPSNQDNSFDPIRLEEKLNYSNNLLQNITYDFVLERSCIDM